MLAQAHGLSNFVREHCAVRQLGPDPVEPIERVRLDTSIARDTSPVVVGIQRVRKLINDRRSIRVGNVVEASRVVAAVAD